MIVTPIRALKAGPGSVDDSAIGPDVSAELATGRQRAKSLPLKPGVSKWKLLDALRPISSPRTRACRRKRISPTVQLQRRPDGSKRVSGVLSCGSVWACPVCAQRICSHRADELKSAISDWKRGSISMLTLTVRHALGHDLRKVRRGVAGAWRRLLQGRNSKHFRRLFHVKHHVRALEVTHGENGWHPHLHILIFGSSDPDEGAEAWLQEAWQAAVEKELGAEHCPDWTHGAQVSSGGRGGYLAKMGLEVAHYTTKRGERSSRSPWQIAEDATADDKSARLWRQYCRDMKGARQLTWSRGARRFFGLGLRDSDAAVVEVDDASAGELLAEWDGKSWDDCVRADPFWVSRIAGCEVWEFERLPAWLRAPRVVAFVPPDVGAG